MSKTNNGEESATGMFKTCTHLITLNKFQFVIIWEIHKKKNYPPKEINEFEI